MINVTRVKIVVNNTDEVKEELKTSIEKALTICGNNWVNHSRDYAPVDTGRLKNSIKSQMQDKNTVAIGTNVEYAVYQELGTVRMQAQPYLRPGGENHINEYKKIIENELKK